MKGANGAVSKSTTLAPVDDRKRNAAGQLLPGQKSLNLGGLNADERAARDAVRAILMGEDMRELGVAAYKRLLQADNPLIVKDFFDRVVGKVKEHVELTGEMGEGLRALRDATFEQLVTLVKAGK